MAVNLTNGADDTTRFVWGDKPSRYIIGQYGATP